MVSKTQNMNGLPMVGVLLVALFVENMSTETKKRKPFRCGLKQHPVDEAIQLCRRLVNDVW